MESWKFQEALVENELGNYKTANDLMIEYFEFDEETYAKGNIQKTAFYSAQFEKLEGENKIKTQQLELERKDQQSTPDAGRIFISIIIIWRIVLYQE